MEPLTLLLVSCGCTLLAVSIALWQNGNARAWEKQADAERAKAQRWQALAMRVPRQPALTVIAPQYHAPRAVSGFDDE